MSVADKRIDSLSGSSAKTALITGGSLGLGKALCDNLLAAGWNIVSVDRHALAPNENLIHLDCDLSDAAAVDLLLEELRKFAPYDLAVFNAGANATGRFQTLPLETHLKLLRLNAETPMVITAFLASNQLMTRASHMAFISSLSHFSGYPGAASYAATKDALAVYAKSIRKSFAKLGITVSAVFPGPLDTEHAARHSPKAAGANSGQDDGKAQRMPVNLAAQLILDDIFKNRKTIIPGNRNKAVAMAGRFAPQIVARIMRQIIFKKLDRDVY